MISFPKVAVLFGALTLIAPVPALAESWVQLNERMTIDADSVLMSGDMRTYWLQFDDGSQSSIVSHEIVNCVTGKKETMESVFYNARGRAVYKKHFRPGEKTKYIIPGSNGAMILDFVCR